VAHSLPFLSPGPSWASYRGKIDYARSVAASLPPWSLVNNKDKNKQALHCSPDAARAKSGRFSRHPLIRIRSFCRAANGIKNKKPNQKEHKCMALSGVH